ncbi:MAG: gliding motility-associated C-terminal domain-containing protein, partial [Bacteroidetes bacterium]|nr:gliding motility-associated C-terminal domain-containing protein [Bacteroidota bacterium]
MLKFVRFFFLFVPLVSISLAAQATHLRAGDITVTRLSCSSYRYRVTLHIYTRANVPVKFSSGNSGELSFGDGSPIFHPHEVDNPPIIGQSDNGPIGEVTYPVDYTYPGPGLYTITYYEQNRNDGVLNMDNSVQTPFFVQTQILIDDFIGGCNNTPQLLVPPVDQGCTGVKWTHNPGAYDPDGDSLSYEKYVPKQGGVYNSDGIFVSAIDVSNYVNPNSQKFYTSIGVPYSQANEAGSGPPDYKIDPISGTITWDAPGKAGEYNIAFIIREWRKVRGTNTWVSLGFVERDMQIVIEDCKNNRPKLKVPPDICVVAGTKITQDIFATNPAVGPVRTKSDGDSTKIEAFSEVFSTALPLATYAPGPSVWQATLSDVQQAHIQFTWQTSCAHVKEQPYQVVFKATDNGAPPLASYETWKIRVVAPAPIWNSAILNPGQRSASLSWQPYVCNNAQLIQVWRKVDSSPFTPPTCVTGMPDYLGYDLIGVVPVGTSNFTDKNLAVGAKYCYRLVAAFPQPDGGESYVSQEICLPPIIVDSPVVTNVSVNVTDVQA